jgi:hypothetical protein
MKINFSSQLSERSLFEKYQQNPFSIALPKLATLLQISQNFNQSESKNKEK